MSSKETEKDKKVLLVKAVLTGEDARKFDAVQKKHGVIHRSEVIRICVCSTFASIRKKA